jgi:cyanophycinase
MWSNGRAELRVIALLLLAALQVACSAATTTGAAGALPGTTGPARGALVIAGGGQLGPEIIGRFVELAGGADARIVVLPGAAAEEQFGEDWPGTSVFREAGVRSVSVLHTRDRRVADSEQFTEALRTATGIWIPGGRQWRLVDAFLGTRTVRELHAALERGAVIGGTSAGASIQASYMVRGAVEGNTVMMAPGYEEGFGFLRGTAIDQHLLARGRENDLLAVIAQHPALLGLGIDEGTALVVRGGRAEVVGRGAVAFYNAADAGALPYYFLRRGGVFDLPSRRVIRGTRIPVEDVRTELEVIAVMDRLFDAMRARDTTAIRAISHPELRIFVPGGTAAAPALRVSTLQEFMDVIAAATERLDETAFEPEVRIDGNLAAIWTYYEFFRGGEFSHCGVDAFHFARMPAGWQITGLAYTVRREGCREP